MEYSKKYPNKRLLIFLDSIDQLQSNDYSDLDWVITGFPANVKLILSTLESYGNIIESLKKRIPEKSLNYLHIVPMTQSNVKIILERWLNESKRSLVDSQWDILDNLFSKATLYPLFIRLIYDIVVKWRSFYVPHDEFKNISTIDDCILYLFKLLEKEHGKILFKRSIFYMNIMKNRKSIFCFIRLKFAN